MTMFSTKYPNTSRTISGTASVYNTDSILAVDTTLVACTINLDKIAQGYWNTTWKLYVYDKSNNAGTNNITINAGSGQTINGQSSLVLSSNGNGVLIRVLSDTQFLATQTIFSPTGLTLTTTGSSGAATLIGSTLNVPNYSLGGSSITSITNATLLGLIAGNLVVAGRNYLITDATNGGGVLVQGLTSNTITESGNGLFYNADYQGAGDYSAISPAYTGFLGVWTATSSSVSMGKVVVYNNRNYVNLTGSWGSAPSGDTTNWSLLSYGLTNGYILESDFVLYNPTTNLITYRADKRGNKVTLFVDGSDNTIVDFPFGNNKITLNTVLGNSYIGFKNSNATITANTLDSATLADTSPISSNGFIQYNYIASNSSISGQQVNSMAYISGNSITENSTLYYTQLVSGTISNNIVSGTSHLNIIGTVSSASINNNTVSNGGSIQNTGTSSSLSITNTLASSDGQFIITSATSLTISSCQASDGNVVTFNAPNTVSYSYKKVFAGFSNWEATINAVDVLAGGILTIPTILAYVGIFTITNVIGTSISSIVNLPTNHPTTLQPFVGASFRITTTAIGSAVATQIVDSTSSDAGGNLYTGRTNGCDNGILSNYGNLIGLTIKNIWI